MRIIKKIGVVVALRCVWNGFFQPVIAHERQRIDMREAIGGSTKICGDGVSVAAAKLGELSACVYGD